GGEQQRVAVARALANRPRIVIADEPTGELDSVTAEQIFDLLREVARGGVTVIAATHDPFVIDHVDRIEELGDGRLLAPEERTFIPGVARVTATPTLAPRRQAPPAPVATPAAPVAVPAEPDHERESDEVEGAGADSVFGSGRVRTAAIVATLLAVTALAGWLRLSDLGRAGLGNHFYAAAVWSMSGSWHNFLYAAFDPAGTLIVDKPPLALWMQVLSTKLLGFEGTAMILPMALAGTLAVPLTFGAGRRSHGVAVGLVAAVLLAVLPESVATARDSTMDALMMALLAASAWLLVAAVEGRSARLLIAWAVLMGVIFNVKYFEGFVMMPAAALYIGLRWRHDLQARLPVFAVAGVALAAVSLLWVGFVELTPASDRPLVMNDESNSVVSLVARYNGLERVLPGDVTIFVPYEGSSAATVEAYETVAAHFGVGDSGPARLFKGANGPLLGIPAAFAVLGVLAVLWRRRDWLDGPGAFWLVWALTGVVLFSFSNRAAAHYTESYAPALALLGAVGIVELWRAREGWRSVALPLAIAALLWFAYYSTQAFPPIAERAEQLAIGGAALAAAALLGGLFVRPSLDLLRVVIVIPALLVPLVTAHWIAFDAPRGSEITRPNPLIYATSELGPPGGRTVPAEAVVARSEETDSGARYMFAIDGINITGESVAYTGASVLPIWSEYQRRPVLPPDELAALLNSGDVPYVLLGALRAGLGRIDEVLNVVQAHCTRDSSVPVGRAWTLWRCPG
ncbi:MAG TPA: glycosyltransferase family 39 protein, partial [Dehalococcoidia bacterium]|nr:glycosyltransferase family 39 protein [Dehalococcoidia bacterium]